MSLILVLALLGVGYLVLTRVGGAVGARVQHALGNRFERAVEGFVVRRRPAAGATVQPVSTDRRLKAGLIDAGGAVAAGLLIAVALGLSTVTETNTLTGESSSSMQLDFNLWWFVVGSLIAYGAMGWRAAHWDDSRQTFGQRLGDYRPVSAGDAELLEPKEQFKRHMLRPVAAPATIAARFQGQQATFQHDVWTASTAQSLY